MSYLKKDAPADLVEAANKIERAADRSYEQLRLLRRHRNVALRALLEGCILRIEQQIAAYGDNAPQLSAALLNLSRSVPIALRWAFHHGRESSSLAASRWTPLLAAEVYEALSFAHAYAAFLGTFPLWHKDFVAAELVTPKHLKFFLSNTPRQRQVSAFQKGFRPTRGFYKGVRAEKVQQTPTMQEHFRSLLLKGCRKTGAARFEYVNLPWDVWYSLLPEYYARTEGIVRRNDDLSLGAYTIGDFKRFYAAFMSICATHEYLCFLWQQQTGAYPVDSALLVLSGDSWVSIVTKLGGIERAKSESIFNDLSFNFSSSVDLHIHPVIPLDLANRKVAVIPAFPLNSRMDENILRVCSVLRPSEFDITSLAKEQEMLQKIRLSQSPFEFRGPINLPTPRPDIDLIIKDERSSTIVVAELKWLRKTVKSLELLSRNSEVMKGVAQLEEIRGFFINEPEYLLKRKIVGRSLSEYRSLFYLLIVRDHWLWFEPRENLAVIEFDTLLRSLKRPDSLKSIVDDLLRYEWLPEEGENFVVRNETTSLNGVSIDTEVYYSV